MKENLYRVGLIGNSPFLLHLISLSKEKDNFSIVGCTTSNHELVDFISNQKIKILSKQDIFQKIEENKIDILFTADTSIIIPEHLINKISIAALNFHNGPLPEYAGVNATSWALFNQENHFGCTIHKLSKDIDSGDIVCQTKFKIKKNDTAFSLNLQCIEEAKLLFNQIIERLANGASLPTKSKTNKIANYHAKHDRPGNFAYLDLSSQHIDANKIIKQINACVTHSNLISDFCIPKIILGNKIFLIDNFYFKASKDSDKKIIFNKNCLMMPCRNGYLVFKDFIDIFGERINSETFQEIFSTLPQSKINRPLPKFPNKISIDNYIKNEKYLIKKFNLSRAKKNDLPFLNKHEGFDVTFSHFKNSPAEQNKLLAAIYAYFSRITNYKFKNIFMLGTITQQNIVMGIDLKTITFDTSCEKKSIRELAHSEYFSPTYAHESSVTVDFFARYDFFDNSDLSVFILSQELFDNAVLQGKFYITINKKYYLIFNKHWDYFFKQKTFEAHLTNFLNAIDAPIHEIDYLTAEEKQLINLHNESIIENETNFLEEIFSHQKENSKNIALIRGDKEEKYDSFLEHSKRIATNLANKGVKSGDKIVVLFSKEKRMFEIKLSLAIFSLGATYIPISADERFDRLETFINIAKPTFIISSVSNRVSKLRKSLSNVMFLTEKVVTKASWKRTDFNFDHALSKKEIAYIMFTSGSTGFPKAVTISYASLNNLIFSIIDVLKINRHDRVLNFSRLSFDASIWEIFPCLTAGATLVLNQNGLIDFVSLQENIKKNRVSIMTLPPSVLTSIKPPKSKYLRAVISAGEPCHDSLIKIWSKNYAFYNAYGPTEATICTSIGKQSISVPVNIGTPLQGIQMWILDKYKNILPPNIAGELYISGTGLMQGYLRDNIIHTEALHKINVFDKNLKAYATGDLTLLRDDGLFVYAGRADTTLIKIRGFRVDLTEVQDTIDHYPHIIQSFLDICYSSDGLISGLACYFVADETFNRKALLDYLAKSLPDYAIPSVLKIVPVIPLNENGKVDKNRLRELCINETYDSKKLSFDIRNKLLYEIYSKTLDHNNFNSTDDFFDLGGDSIKLAKLFSEISTKLHKDISIQQFLTHPCFQNLQRLFERNKKKNTASVNDKFILKLNKFFNEFHHVKSQTPTNDTSLPKTFLITGATGFLGLFLTSTLACNNNTLIYCLVRAKNKKMATDRLIKKFKEYGLHYPVDKIIVVKGDLSRTNLGLSKGNYLKLASSVDKIIHCAYQVLHISSYHSTQKVNVNATFELIKFAFAHKIKTFDFMSTIAAVFSEQNSLGLIEESPIKENILKKKHNNDYLLGKIHSELALYRAANIGLPLNVFRLGWVTGDTNYGYIDPTHNHRLLLLKGCIELGVAPNWDTKFPIVPVDFLSKVIASIHTDDTLQPSVYHVIGNARLEWKHLVIWLVRRGYKIKIIDEKSWVDFVKKEGDKTSLLPLIPIYANFKNVNKIKPLLSITNVKQGKFANLLKKYRIDSPIVDDLLLDKYFSYLEKIQFLPGVWRDG